MLSRNFAKELKLPDSGSSHPTMIRSTFEGYGAPALLNPDINYQGTRYRVLRLLLQFGPIEFIDPKHRPRKAYAPQGYKLIHERPLFT